MPADTVEQIVERWPGYSEQSWQQRFVELDQRFRDTQEQLFEAVRQRLQEMKG